MQFTLLILTAILSAQQALASFNCYTTVGFSNTPSTAIYSGIGAQCNSYQYTCNQNYNATCSPTEITNATVKFAFTFTSNAGCSAMYKDTSFANVCCCSTDLCNSPANVYGCTSAGVVNTSPVANGSGGVGSTSTTSSTSTGKATSSASVAVTSNAILVMVVVLGFLNY